MNRLGRPQLGIVICDFNGWSQTRRCLDCLRRSRFRALEIVVVDHGTTPETQDALGRDYPEVIRISGDPDLWWTGATNLGIKWVLEQEIPYVMLLNNDCYIEPNTIERLVDRVLSGSEAIIAPVQRDLATGDYLSIAPSENLLLGFATLSGPRIMTHAMRARRLLPTRLIGGGRGVLIPAGVFSRVGLLDEGNLPHYYADHDFFIRCRKARIPLLVAVDAEVSIDATRTSMAQHIEDLSWPEFQRTLTSMRSHRNLQHVSALFKKHYPIPPLYFIGLWLFVARYFGVYLFKRFRVGMRTST